MPEEPMANDLAGRIRAIATSTWSDVLDVRGEGGVLTGLVCRSGSGRIAGPAVTVRAVAGPLGAHPDEAFAVGDVLDAVGAGSVLVVALGGAPVSGFGGLAAEAAKRRGAAGVVIDGGCRDVEAIEVGGLWVASRYATPISGKRRVRVEGINVPVQCSGVAVAPGDWIVADRTGVVRIEAARLPAMLAEAEALEARDRQFEAALGRGERFADIARRLGHL
jgi:regulator of RNase E activity RraA